MPIFEYECQDCGARFELIAASRAAKPDSPECPECQGTRTAAMVSACAVGRSGSTGDACSTSIGGT